ncbi:MAG: UTP--glucose-1-phosphate uridylyltransferase [Rhabdochlamydiaceae bacterium]|nr:UTP--glucose-1-phosphate uridylyltransferase [Rhabdochlamydiaceae bacterium]
MTPDIVPLEGMRFMEEIDRLALLTESLKMARGIHSKLEVLDADPRVQNGKMPSGFSVETEFVMKSLMAIGQYEVAFDPMGLSAEEKEIRSKQLLDSLHMIETFYEEIGGIVGYQFTLLQFLHQPKQRFLVDKSRCHAPSGVDLSLPSEDLDEMIYYSIEKMDQLAEMYPVGGAADRLRLQDPETGTLIPAAMLSFNGQTLLGKLIEDLQVREYMYFKIKGKQILLPVAMMTSKEKNNHDQILQLCEKSHWFFRPKEKFSFFCQPLVPVVSREGNWIVPDSMRPLMKPGGHGVIWKLARDSGVISWLAKQGASKAIVRQINNPVSSEDYHLMAFSGYGLKEDKRFGFASCERQVKASEGINVLVEEEKEEGFSYTLTNIEYCDFSTYNIQDEPAIAGGRFSKFPSNTNLLFVDLPSILEALEKSPLPGMLVNMKKIQVASQEGKFSEKEVARLEATMQNVADSFQKHSPTRLSVEEFSGLDSYITFNKRQKTISATKKEFALGSSLLETPEGCFSDVLANTRDLLEDYCEFQLPLLKGQSENFARPSFLFHYHPALGPMYSTIAKKLHKGFIKEGGELRLQIAECEIKNISVQGSLWVQAERVMGEIDEAGILQYSDLVGRCTLKNVTVVNRGIDYSQENIFWKPLLYRLESCHILLKGCSEFYAENITLEGDLQIVVEDGWRVTAKQEKGKLSFVKERIEAPTWRWKYQFNEKKNLSIAIES